jgi:hypothetical protein
LPNLNPDLSDFFWYTHNPKQRIHIEFIPFMVGFYCLCFIFEAECRVV